MLLSAATRKQPEESAENSEYCTTAEKIVALYDYSNSSSSHKRIKTGVTQKIKQWGRWGGYLRAHSEFGNDWMEFHS